MRALEVAAPPPPPGLAATLLPSKIDGHSYLRRCDLSVLAEDLFLGQARSTRIVDAACVERLELDRGSRAQGLIRAVRRACKLSGGPGAALRLCSGKFHSPHGRRRPEDSLRMRQYHLPVFLLVCSHRNLHASR